MKEETDTLGKQQADDRTLVRNFQAGREDAFDSLLVRYKDRVFNICYRFLGDYQESDDTAQDIWVKIYRFLKGFRLEARFSTWLFRVTVNTCKNKLASSQYKYDKTHISLDNTQEASHHVSKLDVRDNEESPLEKIERKERLKLIQKAVNSLSSDHKTVIILRDIEGMSYDEISQIIGHKPGTVKSRLARARGELRKKLKNIL